MSNEQNDMPKVQQDLYLKIVLSVLIGCTFFCFLFSHRSPVGDVAELFSRPALWNQKGFWEGFQLWFVEKTPHPPLGYLGVWLLLSFLSPQTVCFFLGFASLVVGLYFGLRLADHSDKRFALCTALWMLSSAWIWWGIEGLWWDSYAFGVGMGCLYVLHRYPHFRLWISIGVVVCFLWKYSLALWFLCPLLYCLWMFWKEKQHRQLWSVLLCIAIPILLWSIMAGDLVSYWQNSLVGEVQSSSPVQKSLFQRLMFGFVVWKEAFGWFGLVFLFFAFRAEGYRMLKIWSLSGWFFCSLLSLQEGRYFFVGVFPIIFLATKGWKRYFSLRIPIGYALCMWIGTAYTYTFSTTSNWSHLQFSTERLGVWGEWPFPSPAFLPVSSEWNKWKIEETSSFLYEKLPNGTETIYWFGSLKPESPPPEDWKLHLYLAGYTGKFVIPTEEDMRQPQRLHQWLARQQKGTLIRVRDPKEMNWSPVLEHLGWHQQETIVLSKNWKMEIWGLP